MKTCAALLFSGLAIAACADRPFAPAVEAEGISLSLHGRATLRVAAVIPVYEAALYLPEGVVGTEALSDVPKRLEIRYLRTLGTNLIIEAGNDALALNVPRNVLRDIEERVREINSLYRDVKPGDRYALTYIPGRGTELARNDERQGVIPGADFAAAYFSIWLGERAPRADLRDALLNLKK